MNTKYSVLAGVCLLVMAFGVGIGVGRARREKPKPTETTRTTNSQFADTGEALAACKAELETLSQPLPTPSRMDAMTDEAKRAAAREAAKIEALEDELRGCRKSDLLLDAELCRAADRYGIALFMVVLHADRQCVDKPGVGDLILKHTEQCANFEDQTDPDEMDLGELSDQELSNIHDAQRYGKPNESRMGDHKANMARYFKRMVAKCRVKFGLPDE